MPDTQQPQKFWLTIREAGANPVFGIGQTGLRQMLFDGLIPPWAIRRTGIKGGRVYLSRHWLEGATHPPQHQTAAPAPVRNFRLVEVA